MPKNKIISKLPRYVRKPEEGRVNAAYWNITKQPGFKPNPGVTYLWILNADGDIVIGIEEPWKYPQAFNLEEKIAGKILTEMQQEMKTNKILGLGHPTLVTQFDEKGIPLSALGKAKIAGELYFVDGEWQIDNLSGRYGQRDEDLMEVQYFLHEVSEQFQRDSSVRPSIRLNMPGKEYLYLDRYLDLWKKGANESEAAQCLLRDYLSNKESKSVAFVKKILLNLLKNNKLEDFLEKVSFKINVIPALQEDAELIRVMKFIAGQANIPFEIQVRDKKEEVREVKLGNEQFRQLAENIPKLYKKFSSNEKSLFLIALITKNIHLLSSLVDVSEAENSQLIEMISALFKETPSDTMNEKILAILQGIIAKENERSVVGLFITVFEGIPETPSMSPQRKKTLLNLLLKEYPVGKKPGVLSQLVDLSYYSPLPSFRPSLDASFFVPAHITEKQYQASIISGVDISEYLILSIGFLKELTKGKNNDFILDLINDYLFARYDLCLQKITKYCEHKLSLSETHPRNRFFHLSPEQLSDFTHILAASKHLKPFDPEKNDARRFLETRMAQYVAGMMHDEKTLVPKKSPKITFDDSRLRDNTMLAVNKILIYFLGDEGITRTPADLERNIGLCANSYRDESIFPPASMLATRNKCKIFKALDRGVRPGGYGIKERKFEVNISDIGESVWNSNGGAMTTSTPVFLDAQSVPPMRNMIVDAARKSPKDSKKIQWGRLKSSYPVYIASISGHACNMVTMLMKYMADHKDDPQLNQDINLYLIQFAFRYVKRGFHSFLEVADIFNDMAIKEIFSDYGVTIDFNKYLCNSKSAGELLLYGMNDALEYTKTSAMKRGVMHQVVTGMHPSRD